MLIKPEISNHIFASTPINIYDFSSDFTSNLKYIEIFPKSNSEDHHHHGRLLDFSQWANQILLHNDSSRLTGILKRNEQLIILASEHTFQICHALEEEKKVYEHKKHLA